MILSLLIKYKQLKAIEISSDEDLVMQSEKIVELSKIFHSFGMDYFHQIPNSDYLVNLKNLSKNIDFKNIKVLDYKNILLLEGNVRTNIQLLSPEEIIALIKIEDFSENELLMLELFLALPENYLKVNLGFYLETH